jgi:DNA-binding HxlR family transcriptional regulator
VGRPVARALDVIGEKWTLLVLRDLFRKGPLRFQELEQGLAGVAPNTLSARLKALESEGVIATRLYEIHPPRYEYYLTEKGKALGPVLKALYGWGRALRITSYRRCRLMAPPGVEKVYKPDIQNKWEELSKKSGLRPIRFIGTRLALRCSP